MTHGSMTFGHPARLTVPRGSLWAANLAVALISGLRRLDRWQLSLRREEPQTPEDLLAWASRIESSQPAFAADLRGAAQRALGQRDTTHPARLSDS